MTEPDENPTTMDETIALENELEKEPRVRTGLSFDNKPADELLGASRHDGRLMPQHVGGEQQPRGAVRAGGAAHHAPLE